MTTRNKQTRSLGLDVGEKRIGVALSDPQGILASPLTILDRKNETADVESITGIIAEYQVGKVIVGLPRSMDGTIGRQAESVEAFVYKLRGCVQVPIEFRDERLSTASARRLIHEAKAGRAKRKAKDDAIAAAVILQAYLDEEHGQRDIAFPDF